MKKSGITLVTVLSCLFVVWCLLEVYSLRVKQRANHLIRATYEFSERRNPPRLEEIRQAFGSALQQLGPCTRDGCGYEVNVSNRLLYRLHLAPYTNLRTQFWEEKGVIQSNSVQFWTLPHGVFLLVKYCTA